MKYSFGIWDKMFIVPSCVVDKHLKLAGAVQIKVLLWIFRHIGEDFEFDDISKELSVSPADVKDAMQYWFEVGIFSKDEKAFKCEFLSTKAQQPNKEQECNSCEVNNNESTSNKKIMPSRYKKPNIEDISKRIDESIDIKTLMQEAQQILGKTITNSDSGILLSLHDRDGLPVDVIIMLLQYAVSVGKRSMAYIEKVGRSWAQEEIDTLEKAENKIRKLNEENVVWSKFERIIGTDHRAPTNAEKEAVMRWMLDWKYEECMVKEAYDRCVNANGKYVLKYMDSIISRWHKQGIININQALSERKKSSKQNLSQNSNKPSYNIDEYEKYSVFDEEDWEKRFIGG